MFLFLFISVAFSACSFPLKMESIIECLQLADMNHNNELSEMEIAIFMDTHNITETTLTKIMNFCDIDKNGKLTMTDFYDRLSCMRFKSTRAKICYECNKLQTK